MSRPSDHFVNRETTWNELVDRIETGEARGLNDNEADRLYQIFSEFLPEHQSGYPSGMSRLEVWYERIDAFSALQQYIDENYDGDYDIADFIDDEDDWRQNYELIPV